MATSDAIKYPEEVKLYYTALLVKRTNCDKIQRVSFYSLKQHLVIPDWVLLIELEDIESLDDTEKMVLADCTKVNVLDILSTIPSDKLVVAVLCLCRDVIVKELRLSPDQFMLEDYPPVLFLLEKNNDVVALRQLLILNPLEVECSVREDLHSPMTCFLDTKVKTTLDSSTEHGSYQKLTIRESICYESLDDILFVKEKEDDVLPLTLYRFPELINLIILYIHQKVDSYSPNKKTKMRVRLVANVLEGEGYLVPHVSRCHITLPFILYVAILLTGYLLYMPN